MFTELEEDCNFTEECVLASGNYDRIACDLQTKKCQCTSGFQPTRDFGDCTKTNGIFNFFNFSLLFFNEIGVKLDLNREMEDDLFRRWKYSFKKLCKLNLWVIGSQRELSLGPIALWMKVDWLS